jgi:hypothetical protein
LVLIIFGMVVQSAMTKGGVMVFNTTFNNISVICAVSFIDGGLMPRENH